MVLAKALASIAVVAAASEGLLDDDFDDALALLQLRSSWRTDNTAGNYCEGLIYPAQNAGSPTQDLAEAKGRCDANPECVGIHLLRINEYWYQLTRAGDLIYGKGTNWGGQNAQMSVLAKNCDVVHIPTGECAATEYVEGQVDGAKIGVMGATSQQEAEMRCNRDPTCLGIWRHRRNNNWNCYLADLKERAPGLFGYSWRAGWNGPHGANADVQFVKVKGCVTTTTTTTTEVSAVAPPPGDQASAVGDPHMSLDSGIQQDLCCSHGECKPC